MSLLSVVQLPVVISLSISLEIEIVTTMVAVFNFIILSVIFICISVNGVALGLSEGVRCQDQDSDKFLFHYYNAEAYICQDSKSLKVLDYQGGCSYKGRTVFRYINNAWQTCADGHNFADIACVFDEECALKSDLISVGLESWNTASTTGSCTTLRRLMLENPATYDRMEPNFSKCHFPDYVTQSSLITCDYRNFAQKGHDPDDCRNGPDKLVFFVDNQPKHCIIRTRDAFNGLCLPIGRLWHVLKTNYSTYDQREHTYASNFEYRRYALEQKMYMYKTDYGYRNQDLKKIFTTPATFLSTTYPEVHNFQLDEVKVGANVFCEVALKLFPIESYQIYQALLPQRCPCIKQECVKVRSTDLLNISPYPKNLYKVWFDENKLPRKCFLHQIFHGKTDGKNYCINFEAGINLIKTRENNRANRQGYKNDYQASLVRVLQDPPNYQTPWHLRFDGRRAQPLATVLLEMAEALGYFNDRHEVVEFMIGADKLKMGASTFCSILTEMIPFSNGELQGAMEEC